MPKRWRSVTTELADSLRFWRDRVTPADAGLPDGGRRRAPGLRRQEVAQLAGLSVDYLARLEQGRANNPSPSVLAPLARALRLCASATSPGPSSPTARRAGRAPTRRSAGCAASWEQRPVQPPGSGSMTFVRPEIGPITLDCDFLTVRDSDLRVIVLTAAPGSEAASQLDLLSAIGLQRFS